MYIGNVLICLGATIISELLWFVPVTLFYHLGLYSLVVRYEEAHLLEKYGESYRRYMFEVPRWLPTKTVHFKKLGLIIDEYFCQSVIVEFPRLFLLLPYIIKEVIDK